MSPSRYTTSPLRSTYPYPCRRSSLVRILQGPTPGPAALSLDRVPQRGQSTTQQNAFQPLERRLADVTLGIEARDDDHGCRNGVGLPSTHHDGPPPLDIKVCSKNKILLSIRLMRSDASLVTDSNTVMRAAKGSINCIISSGLGSFPFWSLRTRTKLRPTT